MSGPASDPEQFALFDPEVVQAKLMDAMTPGFAPAFDPDEADHAGAFEEDSLSADDADESSCELLWLELGP
jgi:hypothetical protein